MKRVFGLTMALALSGSAFADTPQCQFAGSQIPLGERIEIDPAKHAAELKSLFGHVPGGAPNRVLLCTLRALDPESTLEEASMEKMGEAVLVVTQYSQLAAD